MSFEFEDELEFFSFLPSEFHLDLYQAVSRIIEESLEDTPDIRGKLDRIESSVKKNMLIFERFTLRNIFTFPEDFVLERKLTSQPVASPEVIKEKMLSLSLQKEILGTLNESLHQKKTLLADLSQKVRQIVEVPSLSEITKGLQELNLLIRQTREIKRKYIVGMPQSKPVKKELEEEIRKRECTDLERRIPLEILSNLERAISSEEEYSRV